MKTMSNPKRTQILSTGKELFRRERETLESSREPWQILALSSEDWGTRSPSIQQPMAPAEQWAAQLQRNYLHSKIYRVFYKKGKSRLFLPGWMKYPWHIKTFTMSWLNKRVLLRQSPCLSQNWSKWHQPKGIRKIFNKSETLLLTLQFYKPFNAKEEKWENYLG